MNAIARARIVTNDAGWRLAAAAEAVDRGPFAASLAWNRAAAQTLGDDRLVHVTLHDKKDAPVGLLALQTARANWRTGAPGLPQLGWPMAEIGYGYRPRWLDGVPRTGWRTALAAAFPDRRIELRRCAADRTELGEAVEHGGGFVTTDGVATFVRERPGTVDEWLASLQGRHRRELAKYRRNIEKCGAEWLDTDQADDERLAACLRLHEARLVAKGHAEARPTATTSSFFRALARETAGAGLRLTLLRRDDRFVASCLSFVHERRLQAFLSGWDRAHANLDLGRQVFYHQLLAELPRGLDEIDALGGEFSYKRELGLAPRATFDHVAHGGQVARLCANLVDGALRCYRIVRRRPGKPVVTP